MKRQEYIFSIIGIVIYISSVSYYSPRIIDDTILQTARAVSYLRGHGFTQGYITTTNLAEVMYIPDKTFAPGVEYLLAILMSVFSMSLSLWFATLFAFLLIILGCYYIVQKYISQFSFNAIWIFWAFFLSAPILFQYCGLSDLLALGLFLLAVGFVFQVVEREYFSYRSYLLAFSIGALSYLTCFFRYAYYLFFWIPLFLLLISTIYNRRLWKFSMVALLTTIVLVSIQSILQSGSGGDYLSNRHPDGILFKSLHWKDLGKMTNFIADSSFSVEFINSFLYKILKYPAANTLSFLFQFAICILTIVLLLKWINVIKHKVTDEDNRKSGSIIRRGIFYLECQDGLMEMFIIITICVNLCSLIIFTVILGPSTTLAGWTYVAEKRYYAPLAVSLWLIFTKIYNTSVKRIYIRLLTILVLFSIVVGTGQYFFKIKKKYANPDIIDLYTMSQFLYEEQQGENIFVTPHYGYRLADHAAMGGAYLCLPELIDRSNIISHNTVNIYIPLPDEDIGKLEREQLKKLIKRFRAQPWIKVRTFGVTTIYKVTYNSINQ
ncbi:hypothetical protein QNI19_20585 [Cytophagaceae bacterium DM2B3-1]|uniref:Glycosyltransferase RgtA/B/C/D-like domain-containing protein n=1 Tax=Xanthocytophaga flava TaxID=3048013 RepID=A0ABT7CNL8_9BACT|nr:hypothetical protein [Xanthocytophaga flavus]MDJ1473003.1 hypothetical protein [Xanthocytophaga flavus]MDJ1495349.1 hypothetical protein [Xanthocytophaga flavus]